MTDTPAPVTPQGYAPGHSPNCAIPHEHKGPHEWPGPRPAPVTPRTERDRLFDEVDRRFGRNVARFVDARLDAIAGLEKSSTSFEREAAAPSGLDVERLRQAMILAGWPADGSTATSSIIAAEYARFSEENA